MYHESAMQRFYVARKGDDIIIAHIDEQGAVYLHDKQGYELANKPFNTREEAAIEKRLWSERLKKKPE
jgi:hypothetical protein